MLLRQRLHGPLEPHLPGERLPVEGAGGAWVGSQLLGLAALEVREERDPSPVVALEEHHPDGRSAVRRRGCERHRLCVDDARRARLRQPRLELCQRVGSRSAASTWASVSPRRSATLSAVSVTRSIHIRTELPGPRSRELLERERHAVAHPLIVHLPVFAAEASGATITDVDGNTFVDFSGGVGCMNVGHGHPRVVDAVQEQSARFLHTDFTVVPYEGYVELAERLGALAPIAGPTRAAFFNAGTEAVENAVKLARLYTGRPAVIAFEGAFHGRTLLSLTMTSKPHPYKTGLGPFAPEVYRAPYPNPYRRRQCR